jgi:hypothetical protein
MPHIAARALVIAAAALPLPADVPFTDDPQPADADPVVEGDGAVQDSLLAAAERGAERARRQREEAAK